MPGSEERTNEIGQERNAPARMQLLFSWQTIANLFAFTIDSSTDLSQAGLESQVHLGSCIQIRINTPVSRGKQRCHLIHHLINHLSAHLAGHFDPTGIKIERLTDDDVEISASQSAQVVPVVLATVVDNRQHGRAAVQCQEHNTWVALL